MQLNLDPIAHGKALSCPLKLAFHRRGGYTHPCSLGRRSRNDCYELLSEMRTHHRGRHALSNKTLHVIRIVFLLRASRCESFKFIDCIHGVFSGNSGFQQTLCQ